MALHDFMYQAYRTMAWDFPRFRGPDTMVGLVLKKAPMKRTPVLQEQLYVCMYMYMYICTYIQAFTYIYTGEYKCKYKYMNMNTSVNININTRMSSNNMYIKVDNCMYLRVYICIYRAHVTHIWSCRSHITNSSGLGAHGAQFAVSKS